MLNIQENVLLFILLHKNITQRKIFNVIPLPRIMNFSSKGYISKVFGHAFLESF
jgi:hypothetical protein